MYTFVRECTRLYMNVHAVCYNACTSMYTVSQFRTNLKEALNAAVRGEQVIIERNGQQFELRQYSEATKGTSEELLTPSNPVNTSKPTAAEKEESQTVVEDNVDWGA